MTRYGRRADVVSIGAFFIILSLFRRATDKKQIMLLISNVLTHEEGDTAEQRNYFRRSRLSHNFGKTISEKP